MDAGRSRDYLAGVSELGDNYAPPEGQAELVAALRAGDEAAFASLVGAYGPGMLRVARMYVSTRALAEEVVQETWLAVLQGIDRFEGRSSLKTWIFRILANRAKTRGEREGRTLPFSSLGPDDAGEPAVDPDRFAADGHWSSPPSSWAALPADRLEAKETLEVIRAAIAALPEQQQAVISLRDVEGWSSEEIRNVLGLSESNERVILHRARSKVRRALEAYLEGETA
jgi:RNA polymerase sigma-70 factor (ECF subfamily)